MRRIAVVGASGFIGRRVLAALRRTGTDVIGTSRRGGDGLLSLDAANPSDRPFERLGSPDTVVYLAWGGLPNYQSSHHFEHELPAHYRLLRGLVDAGLRHLVVTGTCFEYGMRNGELDEDLPPMPQNAYGFAKDVLRRQLTFLATEQPFELTWCRLFYMYGEGQAPTSLYSQLRAAIARGDREFPMSEGDQLRDFLPVEEVANAIAGLARRERGGGIVNVCSGRPVSVRSLVEQWIGEAGSTTKPLRGRYPYPAFEPMAFWGSSRKLRGLLTPTGDE